MSYLDLSADEPYDNPHTPDDAPRIPAGLIQSEMPENTYVAGQGAHIVSISVTSALGTAVRYEIIARNNDAAEWLTARAQQVTDGNPDDVRVIRIGH